MHTNYKISYIDKETNAEPGNNDPCNQIGRVNEQNIQTL